MSEMLDTAIAFAEAGLSVQWLRKRSKAPVAEGWTQAEFQDADALTESYREGYNLGLRPGAPSCVDGHYLHVLDFDVKDNQQRKEATDFVRELLGDDLNHLPRVRSGSGGASRHFYFFAPEPLRNGKLKVGTGWEVDLKSTGANLVLPPSIHPDTGNPYTWDVALDLDLLEFGDFPMLSDESLDRIRRCRGKTPEHDEGLADLLKAAAEATRRDLSLDEARLYLARIPLDDVEDYDRWRDVGMALHFQFDGDLEALDVWDEWSAKGGNYQAGMCERKWGTFSAKGDGVTFGTIVHMAGGHPEPHELAVAAVNSAKGYREAIQAVSHYKLLAVHQKTVVNAIQARATDFGMDKPSVIDVKRDLSSTAKETQKNLSNKLADDLETALAKEVLKVHYAHGKHLIYMGKQFWAFADGYWTTHDRAEVDTHTYNVLAAIQGGDGGPRFEALFQAVQESGRINSMNALCDSVASIIRKRVGVGLSKDPLRLNDPDIPAVMNCRNGELWFDEDGGFHVREHDPANFFTSHVAADYDPDAECPLWDQALLDFFGDLDDGADVIRHLHEVLGYLVQFSRFEAMFLLMKGNGSNGKTLITRVLQSLLPNATHQQDIGSMSERRDPHMGAALVGRLAMIDDDYKKGAPLPENALKELSEAKLLTANPKFGASFNFISRAVPIILSNHWPTTRDGSYGIDRRALVFEFHRQFSAEEKDSHLPNRIHRAELSGVLNHLIAGFQRLQARGRFDVPPSCQRAFQAWRSRTNLLSGFLHEATERDPEAEVPFVDVWHHVQAWATASEMGHVRTNKRAFRDDLAQAHGISVTRDHRGQLFVHGLSLVEIDREVDAEAEAYFDN